MAQGTAYKIIYDNFLSLVTDDLYSSTGSLDDLSEEEIYSDTEVLLVNAISKFFLPKEDIYDVTIVDGEKYFTVNLSSSTIMILTLLMIKEWLARQMNSVRITETQYTGSDAKSINTKTQADAIRVAQEANALSLKQAYHSYQYQSMNEDTRLNEVTDLDLTSGTSYSNIKTRGKYHGN